MYISVNIEAPLKDKVAFFFPTWMGNHTTFQYLSKSLNSLPYPSHSNFGEVWKAMDPENRLEKLVGLHCSFYIDMIPFKYLAYTIWVYILRHMCVWKEFTAQKRTCGMRHKSSLWGVAWRGSCRLWCRPFLGLQEFPSGSHCSLLNVSSRSSAFVADVPCVVFLDIFEGILED